MLSRVSPKTTVIFLSLTGETAQHGHRRAVSLKEALGDRTLIDHILAARIPRRG